MKRLLRQLCHGQGGFTLIELLIVIAILGIIAAIVVPNVSGFMASGTLNGAQTEAENVKTAAVAFLAETGTWPTDQGDLGNYLEGVIKGTYNFGGNAGIETADPGAWGEGISWDSGTQTWVTAGE